MNDIVKAKDLVGRRVDLPDGRYVFVGNHPDYPDHTGFVFRNSEGTINSFRLSPEAREALTALLTNPTAGEPGSPLPPKVEETKTYVVTWREVP